MSEGSSVQPTRYAGWLPETLLALGLVSVSANWVLLIADPLHRGDPFLAFTTVIALVSATIVRLSRPGLPIGLWLTLSPIGASALSETVQFRFLDIGASALALAWVTLLGSLVNALGLVSFVHAIALYPEGFVETARQRALSRVAWLVLLLPPVVAFSSATIPLADYIGVDAVDNPLQLVAVDRALPDAVPILSLPLLLAAVATLAVRYRAGTLRMRRRVRWLLAPLVLLVLFLVTVLFVDDAGIVVWAAFLVFSGTMPIAAAIGILEPSWLDVDSLLRRMLVYGLLWTAISATYVGLGTLVGVTAGNYLPVGWSIAAALVAAMLFQPARSWLGRLADRWVFGRRTDPAQVLTRLGDTLARTFDLESLLPRMTSAVEEGLNVTWARVSLNGSGATSPDVALEVPVVLDGETVGVVECGPKRSGAFTPEDRQVLETFARQAALAVGNARLTERLRQHAMELAASRARLVRAQEAERRRIERNIHDGVQQDLVALIGVVGQWGTDPRAQELETVRAGLVRVLDELRDLARGIHPSLLSDQGLLPAVEALSARHPVPVDLRADATIRRLSISEEKEGACYFTVAEALANSAKHARASRVEVVLARQNGSLDIRVSDDGVGFDPERLSASGGLAGLRDRLAAVDGALAVISAPGEGATVSATVGVGPQP